MNATIIIGVLLSILWIYEATKRPNDLLFVMVMVIGSWALVPLFGVGIILLAHLVFHIFATYT